LFRSLNISCVLSLHDSADFAGLCIELCPKLSKLCCSLNNAEPARLACERVEVGNERESFSIKNL
jgi:hypothetical protein